MALKINWPEVRRAVESGMTTREAATLFDASYAAVRQRALRERWITPGGGMALSQQLSHPVAGSSALHAIDADWVARQAAHRTQIHKLGSGLLDAADLAPPAIETVNDLAAIDKMMRQNLDLQNTSEGATVNVLFD